MPREGDVRVVRVAVGKTARGTLISSCFSSRRVLSRLRLDREVSILD